MYSHTETIIHSFSSSTEISKALDKFVAKASDDAIKLHGRFTIALSGGSLPKTLASVLKHNKEIDFSKWHVFFADERAVPLTHEDSNYLLAKNELLSHVPIPDNQIYAIDERLLDNIEELAEAYESRLVKVFNDKNEVRFPALDLAFLGIGPDGHTCSLFPGHELLEEKDLWVAPIEDSPKPPPKRITLTYPILNHAHIVAFVVTGDNKKEMLVRILEEKDKSIPATRVQPAHGKLYWFLDAAASASLTQVEIEDFQ